MPSRLSRRRFDAVEVSLMVVLAAALAAIVSSSWTARKSARVSYPVYSTSSEAAFLEDRYGPAKYSRHEEEWIIRDYFKDKRGGVFVDVGANHYRNESNTYFLESVLSWSGVAIDPQAAFAAEYREHRPRTQFFTFFVSDESDTLATLYVIGESSLVSSADRAFTESGGTGRKQPVYTANELSVPSVRLTDLLDRLSIAHVDLLSIDVELAEPKVLAGFDIGRFRPSLVCIEAHPQVRQEILDYFAANDYVLVGKYLRADLRNLWFIPEGQASPSAKTMSLGAAEGTARR